MIKTSNNHLYELEVVKKSKPALAFDEKADFLRWRKLAYDKLLELLGLPLEAGSAFEFEYKTEKDGYTEYRFTVETEPGYHVPCHLLVNHAVIRNSTKPILKIMIEISVSVRTTICRTISSG